MWDVIVRIILYRDLTDTLPNFCSRITCLIRNTYECKNNNAVSC